MAIRTAFELSILLIYTSFTIMIYELWQVAIR